MDTWLLCGSRTQLPYLKKKNNTHHTTNKMSSSKCVISGTVPRENRKARAHRNRSASNSPELTDNADDEGEQVNDAVKHLHILLRLITEHSIDQDGWEDKDEHK